MAGKNSIAKFRDAILASHVYGCTRKLVYLVRSLPRGPDGSSHVEVSMFTPEAISGKTFRRLTKEKATLAREID